MAASACNYIIVFDGISQVYGTASEKTALASPPPKGSKISEKHVFFINYEPDTESLAVYKVDQKEVINAYEETIKESEGKD